MLNEPINEKTEQDHLAFKTDWTLREWSST